VYFPGVDFSRFDNSAKVAIEEDINRDFDHGFEGIKQLPHGARLGVYVAYRYYLQLFKKIRNQPAHTVAEKRIRVSDKRKAYLLFSSTVRHSMNFL
jgi:phytoene/squalene synthetase